MSDLKACPFCGRSAIVTEYGTTGQATIKCHCGMVSEVSGDFALTARMWNARPVEERLIAERDELRSQQLGMLTSMDTMSQEVDGLRAKLRRAVQAVCKLANHCSCDYSIDYPVHLADCYEVIKDAIICENAELVKEIEAEK